MKRQKKRQRVDQSDPSPQLPWEMVEHILRKLPHVAALARCQLVCRSWRAALTLSAPSARDLWRQVYLATWPPPLLVTNINININININKDEGRAIDWRVVAMERLELSHPDGWRNGLSELIDKLMQQLPSVGLDKAYDRLKGCLEEAKVHETKRKLKEGYRFKLMKWNKYNMKEGPLARACQALADGTYWLDRTKETIEGAYDANDQVEKWNTKAVIYSATSGLPLRFSLYWSFRAWSQTREEQLRVHAEVLHPSRSGGELHEVEEEEEGRGPFLSAVARYLLGDPARWMGYAVARGEERGERKTRREKTESEKAEEERERSVVSELLGRVLFAPLDRDLWYRNEEDPEAEWSFCYPADSDD